MKTKLIVEIEHDEDISKYGMRQWAHDLLLRCSYAGQLTVTLAEPLQVRDTMPEARIAAMQRVGEVLP